MAIRTYFGPKTPEGKGERSGMRGACAREDEGGGVVTYLVSLSLSKKVGVHVGRPA